MKFTNNIQTGKQGEELAVEYLKNCGMKIIDRNWHYSKNAEIDIIAEDNGILVFIEVKTRKTLNYGHPFEAIDINKINKIKTAAMAYLHSSSSKYNEIRIDGIAIIGISNFKIEHIKNIGQF